MANDNPIATFLIEKRAGVFSAAGPRVAQGIRKGLEGAAIGTATSLAAASLTVGAAKVFDAATKGRDFRRMLDFPLNEDLRAHHERDPEIFNGLYSSLRAFNPAFARDPVVAGTYMRRMVDSPMAGGILTDALSLRDRVPSPIRDALTRGVEAGVKSSFATTPT